MTGSSLYASASLLNWVTGKQQTTTLSNALIGLFTVLGSDDGNGFTEVSGGSYARAATTAAFWGSPTGIAQVQIVNSRSIPFPVSSSAWGSVVGFGVFDTNGNLMWSDYFGNFVWLPFTATAGSPGVFTAPGHGLVVNDKVALTGEYGGQLPQGSTSLNGLLTVVATSGDTVNLGANITVAGSGMLRKVVPLTIGLNQTATFNPAALVLQVG